MHKQTPKRSRVPLLHAGKATLLLLALGVLLFPILITSLQHRKTAYAAGSTTLNFQMRLLGASGSIVPDGDYNIEFKLYSAETSSGSSQGDCTGDGSCVWTETRTGANKVRVVNGYATANLGSVTAFGSTINWQEELWLTVNIGGTGTADWDGEMDPRMKVTAVPFAFRAGELAKTTGGTDGVLRFDTLSGTDKLILLPNASGTVAVSASGNIALDSSGNITFTGQLPIASGGTNATTAQGAINNLSGLTTAGDLLYFDGTNATRLARGTDGQCLTSTSTTLQWGSCGSISGFVDNGTLISLQTNTDKVTIGSGNDLSAQLAVDGNADQVQMLIQGHSTQTSDLLVVENSNGDNLFAVTGEGDLVVDGTTLYVDASNDRVGIGKSDPGHKLDVNGDGRFMNAAGAAQLFVTSGEDSTSTIWLGEEDSPTSGSAIQADNSNGYLYLRTSGQNAIVIDNFNKVGIGQTGSLGARLDVLGATSGSVDALRVSNNTSTGDVAEFYDDTTLIAKFHDGGAVTIDSGNFTIGAASTAGTLALMSGTGNSASLSAASLGVGLLLQDSGMTAGVTGGGLQITSGAAANDADAAALLAGATTNDHSTYTARSTHASGVFMQDGAFHIFANQSLTAGNSFTPLTRLTVAADGHVRIGSGGTVDMSSPGDGDLYVQNRLEVDGNVTMGGTLNVGGETVLNTLSGGGLTDCDDATTSKLLWDSATKQFSCGTDGSGGVTGGVTTVGTIDSQTKSTDGAVISGTTIYMQTADATHAGLVSTGSQTFAGDKTFTGAMLFQNATDSGSALLVQNAGGANVLKVDTTSKTISIGDAVDFDSPTLLQPTTQPPDDGRGVAWSPDSLYVAVAGVGSPYVNIYKRSGDTFTKLSNPANLPAGTGNGVAWSPDGTYLSIAHTNSPYITIYKRSGDTFTKLSNPANLPAGTGNGVAWSPDGNYMSVAHANSPYITIYKRSGDTFTKLTNPGTLPTGNGTDSAWSPDGNYMAVSHANSPRVTIYSRSGDTFTKLSNPANLPTNNAQDVTWSPNGQYMAVAHWSSPYVTIYEQSGSTFTKQANPSSLLPDNAYGVAWSPNGMYLSVVHNVSGGDAFGIYKGASGPADMIVNGQLMVNGGIHSENFVITSVGYASFNGALSVGSSASVAGFLRVGSGGTNTVAAGAGDVYVQNALEVDGETVLNTLSGAGLVDCDNGTTSKLLWDSATKQFSCGTDLGGVTTIGTLDSQTKNANGAVISGSNLVLQTADATNVGLMSTGAQALAGDKTFNGRLKVGSGGTVDFATGAGSLYVQNNLEVDGDVDFGDNFYVNSTTGVLHLNSFANMSSGSYAMVELLTTGTQFYRDRADAGTALTVRQDNASSTGHILDLHNNAGSVLHVKQTGELVLSTVSGAGLTDCDGTGSALQWDSSTKQFSCAVLTSGVTSYYRYKSTDETRTGTSSPTADGELQFTAGTNEEWIIEGYIDLSADQASLAGSYKVAVIAPAGSTCQMIFTDPDRGEIGTHNYYESESCGSSTGPGNSSYGGVTHQRYKFTASIKTASTGGVVAFGWSNYYGSPAGYNATVHAGSTLVAFKDTGADLAELYNSTEADVTAGEVVMIDASVKAGVKRAVGEGSQHILGVIATRPAEIYGDELNRNLLTRPVPVALVGRVPVKVNTQNGAIKAGDLLTASNTPGIAMKATKPGYVIGRALDDYDGSVEGVVLTFVNTHYADPSGYVASMVQEGGRFDQLSSTVGSLDSLYGGLMSQLDDQKSQISSLMGNQASLMSLTMEQPREAVELNVANTLTAGRMYVQTMITTENIEVDGEAVIGSLHVKNEAIFDSGITVLGETKLEKLVVTGHVVSQGAKPGVEIDEALPDDMIVEVDGTDTAGTITIKTGATPITATQIAKLKFAKQYGNEKAPRVLLAAANEATVMQGLFADQAVVTDKDFAIMQTAGKQLAPNAEYVVNYYIVQTLALEQ